MKNMTVIERKIHIYQEIQRKHDNQCEIDDREKYHCH